MEVTLYSPAHDASEIWSPLTRSRSIDFKLKPWEEKKLPVIDSSSGMIYFDLRHLTITESEKILQSLQKSGISSWGIFASNQSFPDPAICFFYGAGDLLYAETMEPKKLVKRVQRAAAWIASNQQNSSGLSADTNLPQDQQRIQKSYIWESPMTQWKNLKSGKTYSFLLLYLSIDKIKDLQKALSGEDYERFISRFETFTSNHFANYDGKMWIWQENHGVILFPLNQDDSIVWQGLLHFYMNHRIFQAEVFGLSREVSYRMALHAGSTEYQPRGKTGGIVNDTLNSLFHMGSKKSNDKGLILSEEAASLMPGQLNPYFVDDGEFENRQIYRFSGFCS